MIQENKARQIFGKTTFLTPWCAHFLSPNARKCAYQRVRNFRFLENLTCFVFLKHPFWDSPFCLITDYLSCKLKSIIQISLLYVFRIGCLKHWLAESLRKLLLKFFLVSLFLLANNIRKCRTRALILIFWQSLKPTHDLDFYMWEMLIAQSICNCICKCHLFLDLYQNITLGFSWGFYYASLKTNDPTLFFYPIQKYFTKAMFLQCS